MYTKQFEIRWNDLDANMHLGNSSYIEFMSHTRMSFLTEQGIGLQEMNAHGLGPIVIYEHIHYFKEIESNSKIIVSLEVSGMSKDSRFILIEHNFYDKTGKNLAYAEVLFSWINIETRRLGVLSSELLTIVGEFPKSKAFKMLTYEDTRKNGIKPQNINL
jgi:acyl-CoA thioester hydrolase